MPTSTSIRFQGMDQDEIFQRAKARVEALAKEHDITGRVDASSRTLFLGDAPKLHGQLTVQGETVSVDLTHSFIEKPKALLVLQFVKKELAGLFT